MQHRNSLADQFGDPFGTYVTPGEYRCHYRGSETGWAFGSQRTFCWFTIAPDQEGAQKPLIRVYNAITKPFVPRSHNVARDYYAVTERRAPVGVKPDDFLLDCEILAEVVTVNAKDTPSRHGSSSKDWGPPYSKISAVLKVTAGTPPCRREQTNAAS